MARKINPITDEEMIAMISDENLPKADYDDDDMITNQEVLNHWIEVRDNIVSSGLYQSTDELSWTCRNLHRLLNLCISLKQLSIPTTDYLECKRVIKLKKYIPKYVYTQNDVESVYLDAVYAVVDGILLTPYQSGDLSHHKAITSDVISSLGLPQSYKYGVMKPATNDSIFVLKNNEFNSYITHTSQWEYFNLISGVESLMIY